MPTSPRWGEVLATPNDRGRRSIEARRIALLCFCSGLAHVEFLRRSRLDGWRVTLLFLWLPSPEAAIERVARRVRQGGHDIPPDVIMRRYEKGVANMRTLYLPLADVAAIYDNSDAARTLVAERKRGTPLIVHDGARWAAIEGTMP